ncbi:MAG: 3-isopropylmalate dehydratase [Desulfobacterales bacterium]|jgi:3-isopropylmalate/(R)-2-methylmalate dehydratase small subunit|nr:3-isopropylmalate dehydratase [Desulfobacterales bacterium]
MNVLDAEVETSRFSKRITGRVIKLGDAIDTDLIYPGRYVPVVDPAEWPRHALEGIDPNFPSRLQPGDIIVAGRNFGCGSSRSQAVSCLKLAGIVAIVAASFGRIFFRNAINQGVPVIECADAHHLFQEGETLRIDLAEGRIEGAENSASFQPLPAFMMAILGAGGLVPFTRALLAK